MRARNDVERADIAQLMVSSGEDITVNDSYGLEGVTTCSNLSSTSAVLVIRLHDLGGQHSLCPGIARSADRHPSVDLVTLAPRPEFSLPTGPLASAISSQSEASKRQTATQTRRSTGLFVHHATIAVQALSSSSRTRRGHRKQVESARRRHLQLD